MIRKNITIREDQEEFIVETSLNLSRFVQKKLDEIMKKQSFLQGQQEGLQTK